MWTYLDSFLFSCGLVLRQTHLDAMIFNVQFPHLADIKRRRRRRKSQHEPTPAIQQATWTRLNSFFFSCGLILRPLTHIIFNVQSPYFADVKRRRRRKSQQEPTTTTTQQATWACFDSFLFLLPSRSRSSVQSAHFVNVNNSGQFGNDKRKKI